MGTVLLRKCDIRSQSLLISLAIPFSSLFYGIRILTLIMWSHQAGSLRCSTDGTTYCGKTRLIRNLATQFLCYTSQCATDPFGSSAHCSGH